ncbi:extracellular solute-binding protein [Synechococcus sp. Nb3U1]|uniref:ABC transporter substrate-binding protein n=1 Tax=Synechococcus sp. Nb3U1 TaxID=1914529 RepID=UPI001F182992|nr:extracellular solute-binding protein [Synechococcus sp. Nb3U1]MCF2969996.1 extracellular solute-binding protein [Synechococcus sp. Nb3U1]
MSTFQNFNRRRFLQLSALANAGLITWFYGPRVSFAQSNLPAPPPAGPIDLQAAGGMEGLIAAARAEGELSTTALPDDWANYGGMKKTFFSRYNFLKHNDLTPEASSAEEIEQIKANAGNKGPQNPDVIDVGFVWGAAAKAENLLQPYKVATWDTIPDEIKDPDGFWYGNYYGTMAFEVNADAVPFVPQDWNDLLDPRLKGLIAINDPVAGSQNTHSVWAASLADGGSLDQPEKGIEFFKKLAQSGNLVPTGTSPSALVSGELPITLRWDYNALATRDNNANLANIQVIYPKSGTLAGVYLCAINAYAPRPHAARLWMEFVYSDEGQLLWLEGYAKPVRFDDMLKRGVIPQELLAQLPAADVRVEFPSLEQLNTGLQYIRDNWAKEVGITYAS